MAETAVVLPVLITMILGGVEVARFAVLHQKLDRLAMVTSDMVSQGQTISAAELDVIMAASTTVLKPFRMGADGTIVVTSVTASGGAPPRVAWQRRGGGTLPGAASKFGGPGNNATLPPGFQVRDSETAIIAEVYFDFSPMFIPDLLPPQRIYRRAVFRPRAGTLETLG